MQMLFQLDLNPDVPPAAIRQYVKDRLGFPQLETFAMDRIEGVRRHRAAIDQLLAGAATHWSVDRMAAVDRNTLRLAVYELQFCPDVPLRVAINEALEIARRFSTEESVKFVNGVLDRIATEVRPADRTSLGGNFDSEMGQGSAAEASPQTPPAEGLPSSLAAESVS